MVQDIHDIVNEPVEIRLSHAKNHDTSPDLLRVLSKDSFWFVRDFVAMNPNTPEDCLFELMEDEDFRIRGDAEKTLGKQHRKITLLEKIQEAERKQEITSLPYSHIKRDAR